MQTTFNQARVMTLELWFDMQRLVGASYRARIMKNAPKKRPRSRTIDAEYRRLP